MTTSTPSWLLGALGALAITASGAALAGDPSTWTCETCPFEKAGVQGSVDVGVGAVSDKSARFGDFTGLDKRDGFAVLGGEARWRGDGLFGGVSASDLGLDVRSLAADLTREGLFSLRLGYAELPHRLSDSASTPFLGVGSGSLSLPAGFPAASTVAMPLDSTLAPVELGFKRKRLDLAASIAGPEHWRFRVDARHDVRDGTQRFAGSFFSTTSQLVAPVDQVTDSLELSASYATQRLQASLAWRASTFRNGEDSLTWQNPFTAPIAGATSGQLALAPDNRFQQWAATVGYQIAPTLRASAELALGRMTQDSAFLPATLNPNLAVTLPASSLDGRADTLDLSLRLSAAPVDRVNLSASYTRNERDDKTARLAWPAVSTDMFLGSGTVLNRPYSFTRDRLKLAGDYRGTGSLKLAAGIEQDNVERTLQEVDTTRETTVWARARVLALDKVWLSAKVSHAERDNSGYHVVAEIQPPENPLLRRFNLADRSRDAFGLRADAALGEALSLGLLVDVARDDYENSPVGLTAARSESLGVDLSYALSDATQLRGYVQGERMRSQQSGSQQVGSADWTGRTHDRFELLGLGLTHNALKGKLVLGADLTLARSRSRIEVDTGAPGTAFPTATSSRDSLKLSANYQLRENLSLLASYWYESLDSRDWRLDGVLPATVANVLSFGELAPRYHVNVVRVALRYRF